MQGLQSALDAKQATILDGGLSISKTLNLQSALDAKQPTINTDMLLSVPMRTMQRCEATSICTAQGAAKPACSSCAREAQLEWQLPARAVEQKEQGRRDSYEISQRNIIFGGLQSRS